MGNIDLARDYLQQLDKINVSGKSQLISQFYRVAEAIVLKSSNRARNRGKAEILLGEVIEEKIIYHELTVHALLQLCELLLLDLKISGDKEVLGEVKTLTDHLLAIATQQHSHRLLVETYLFQSKLALVELDTSKARKLMTRAENTAAENGLQWLALKVSKEHDMLLARMDEWKKAIEINLPMEDRIELAGLDEQLDQTINKRLTGYENIREEKEELELFLYLITHDLKNYHTCTQGSIELARRILQKTDEADETYENLDVILPKLLELSLSGIAGATGVINSVNTYLKQQVTREYRLQPVNLSQTIVDSSNILKRMYPDKKIVVNKKGIPKTAYIMADSLFSELFLNLFTNAVKNDSKDVVRIDVSLSRREDFEKVVVITVSDWGRGIPPSQREMIFEKFSEFRKKGSGSGLGMYIVKALVNRYNGRIWIESRVHSDYSQGTKINLQLFIDK